MVQELQLQGRFWFCIMIETSHLTCHRSALNSSIDTMTGDTEIKSSFKTWSRCQAFLSSHYQLSSDEHTTQETASPYGEVIKHRSTL